MDELYLQLESFGLVIPTIAQIQDFAPTIILGCALLLFYRTLLLPGFHDFQRNRAIENDRKSAIERERKRASESEKRAINSELRKQKSSLVTLLDEVLHRQGNISSLEHEYTRLKSVDFKRLDPEPLLQKANSEELANLRKVLLIEQGGAQGIVTEVRSAGSHTFGTLFRRMDGSNPHVPYMEVVDDVLEQVGGSTDKEHNYFEKECQIIEQYTSQMMADMSDAEQQQFIDGLKQEAEKNGESFSGVIGAGGSIVLANASGFGVYLLASTMVGSITSILGIALPFAFYTSMSSTIAMLTGPAGWAILALWGVSKVGSPNKKKTLPSVIMVAAVRARLIAENEKLMKLAEKQKNKDISNIMEEIISRKAEVNDIKQYIDELKQQMMDINT